MIELQKHQYIVTMVSLSKTIEMEFSSTDEEGLKALIGDFLMLFSKSIDVENKKINLSQLQQNTSELRENFSRFVDAFKDSEPKVNQLNTYLRNLETEEKFFLFVNTPIDSDTHINLSAVLTAIKHGQDYVTIQKQMDELFKELRNKYDILVFDKNTKRTIGETDKNKRICRFCGKGQPNVLFKSVAHAVSEALGNKKIILNEECDDCNNKFGSLIEINLIEYLRFFCVFYGIKGKGKTPEITEPSKFPIPDDGKNFSIKNTGVVELKYYQTEGNEIAQGELPTNFELKSDKEVVLQSVYKTLCKYALSVIDSKYIPAFGETIKWLNGEKVADRLPKVAMLVTNTFFDPHPRLTLYVRKLEDYKLPFLVGELNFTAFTYSFILPFCANDKIDFLKKDDYMHYWGNFKHYSKLSGWRFLDFSDNQKQKVVIKLNLEQRK